MHSPSCQTVKGRDCLAVNNDGERKKDSDNERKANKEDRSGHDLSLQPELISQEETKESAWQQTRQSKSKLMWKPAFVSPDGMGYACQNGRLFGRGPLFHLNLITCLSVQWDKKCVCVCIPGFFFWGAFSLTSQPIALEVARRFRSHTFKIPCIKKLFFKLLTAAWSALLGSSKKIPQSRRIAHQAYRTRASIELISRTGTANYSILD